MYLSYYRSLFKHNPNWGYWYRENFYGRVPGQGSKTAYYTVKTNAVGARTSHEPEHHLSGGHEKRIMFLGCSYTAGDGVPNNKRFSDLIEKMMPDVHCHNYALSGSGHDQQNLIHRHFSPKIKPHILIVSPYTGCLGRNILSARPAFDPLTGITVMRPKPYFELYDDQIVLKQSPVPRQSVCASEHFRAQQNYLRLNPLKGMARHLLQGPLQFVADWYKSHSWPVNDLYLNDGQYPYHLGQMILKDILMSSKASLKVIMPLPAYRDCKEFNRSAYRKFYNELALMTGSKFIDCLPIISTKSSHELETLFSSGDGHYTHLGHKVIADYLASRLSEYFL